MNEVSKKKIMLVFGTRPEAIKMCPLVKELKKREYFETVVCVTGQHREMLDGVLEAFCVTPEYDLSVMKEGQSLTDITAKVLTLFEKILEKEKPDTVLVHGDTSSAFAAALTCFYKKIPVGHVEAGLRTYDIYNPFPEEFNRRAISLIAKYNFAPTEETRENLVGEGVPAKSVYVTGNTVIDSLKTTVKKEYRHFALDWTGENRLVLLTVHRRENIGTPMRNIFRAVRRAVSQYSDVRIVYPVHMNPKVRKIASEELEGEEKILLTQPLDVIDFHNVMARSYLILTDSGGIQEEASALSKPGLVARDTTERTEGIKAGTIKLVGTQEKDIYENFLRLLENKKEYSAMVNAKNPYGDGSAIKNIADMLEKALFLPQNY